MLQIYGAVEARVSDEWYEVINVSSLLMQHADLNGCLFGVDNYAGYVPLYPDRGLPIDCSETLRTRAEPFLDQHSHTSWVLWSELKRINWEERATGPDQRVTELAREAEVERVVGKWLNEPHLQPVRDALDRDPNGIVLVGGRLFKRLVLSRKDSLMGTDFPLVMNLMRCLAERFGDDGVRLTVWFG